MEWRDQEFIAQREHQAGPADGGPSDAQSQSGKAELMSTTPPGEPPVDYDVRSTYESRPVNARDFNISAVGIGTVSGSGAIIFPQINFQSVLGWRFVALEWEIVFSPSLAAIGGAVYQNTTVNLLAGGGVADPFNQAIVVGPNGTGGNPLQTFMLIEEDTRFGIQILNTDTTLAVAATVAAIVTVYGNALPVTDVQLPYSIANPVRGPKFGMGGPPMPFMPPMPVPAAPAAPPAPAAAAPVVMATPTGFVPMPRPRVTSGWQTGPQGGPVIQRGPVRPPGGGGSGWGV